MKNIRLIEINTTAFEDENFYLITDLSDRQVENVLTPIIENERENENDYDNDYLLDELIKNYPKNIIIQYTKDSIDYINF